MCISVLWCNLLQNLGTHAQARTHARTRTHTHPVLVLARHRHEPRDHLVRSKMMRHIFPMLWLRFVQPWRRIFTSGRFGIWGHFAALDNCSMTCKNSTPQTPGFGSHVLGRASASLTVRTEIGPGTIYKFVGAIYKIEISILTEKRQIQEGGCHTCGTVQRAAEQPAHGTMFFPSSLPWSICTLISHRQLLLMGQPKV